MAQRAASNDIWSSAGQLWLADRLNQTPGRDASVKVIENRVHVSLVTPSGPVEWVLESGSEWTVVCPDHGTSCGAPFASTDASVVADKIDQWATSHG
jgi:hypothetical protein